MTPERWQQIKPILNEAREHPKSERRVWLAEACRDDSEFLRDVESFLEHEEKLEGFIEEPILSLTAEKPHLDENEEGRTIGPYRLVRLLDKGGMGAVYLAERQEEFEQRVALKLIRRGIASHETIRRFHAERQILARLEHPNIARLLDGGTTEDNEPYFAMELVEGMPIHRYCDEHRLTTRQRLELFLPVCSALELAHQNLIIHRDLKPGNILVDASGTAKLLDFGIAKLLPTEDVPGSLNTPTQQQALTLCYASPEQLRGEPVGTSSDVYSLGVMLYLVLTGRLPCDLEKLNGLNLMRAVCEQDPLPPSAVVLSGEELESLSAVRDGNARLLQKCLTGDVDSIVMKALSKDPRQRYASVEQLAADIRRHFQDLPVRAHPGGTTYRTGRFVRRHRWGLTVLGALLMLAFGFTTVLMHQLRETEKALGRAEAISEFVFGLFQAAAPNQAPEDEPTMRELLDFGRGTLAKGLEEEPEFRATLHLKMGEVYHQIGDYPAARELFEQSIKLLRLQHDGDHPELATALSNLATVQHSTGALEAAEGSIREAIDMRRRLGDKINLNKPKNNLAAILLARGRFDDAANTYRETLVVRRQALASHLATGTPDDVRLAQHRKGISTNLRNLGTALYNAGDLGAAEPLLREAHEIRLELFGAEHTSVASTLFSLGRLKRVQGNLDEAEALSSEALRIRRRNLGERHHGTALAGLEYANLLLDRGEYATVGVLLPRILETLYRIRSEGDWQIAEAESLLGVYLATEGKYEMAKICLRESWETLEKVRGPQADDTRMARQRLESLEDKRSGDRSR